MKKVKDFIEEYRDELLRCEYSYFFGVDPSLSGTGLCVLDSNSIVHHMDVIRPLPCTSIQRVNKIVSGVLSVLRAYKDVLVVIEKPFGVMGSGLILLELNGAIKDSLFKESVLVVQVSQTVLKKFATDKGNAKKNKMAQSLEECYGIQEEQGDKVDAFWLAKFGYCLKNDVDFEHQRGPIKSFWKSFSI